MRFIEPVAPRQADGLVAEIYGEIRRDFALLRDPSGNSPFMAHLPHRELLAALWSGLYETMRDTSSARLGKAALMLFASLLRESRSEGASEVTFSLRWSRSQRCPATEPSRLRPECNT